MNEITKELIINVARVTNPDLDRINFLLSQKVDWWELAGFGRSHKILNLFGLHCFQLENSNLIPKPLVDLVSDHVYSCKRKTSILSTETRVIGENCQAKGSSFYLLKGLALVPTVYSDFSQRFSSDIDVLVTNEDELNILQETLFELGYVQARVLRNWSKEATDLKKMDRNQVAGYMMDLKHLAPFRKIIKSSNDIPELVTVEVHHRLTDVCDGYAIDLNKIVEEASSHDYYPESVKILSNETFLLHLFAHLYLHTRSIRDVINGEELQLRKYVDIIEFVGKMPIKWEKFVSLVLTMGMQLETSFGIDAAIQIYGNKIQIPNFVLQRLVPPGFEREKNSIAEKWFFGSKVNVGYWANNIAERLFDPSRSNFALTQLYNYLNNLTYDGAKIEIVKQQRDKE